MDRLTNIDWSLIRSFLAVAETGSLSAAARRLGASQPTLGRQIKEAERALGVTLFHRQPRGFALTDAGHAMLPAARDMQAAMNDIAMTVAGRDTEAQGLVRITASEMVAQHILPPTLAKLRHSHPDIQIVLIASDETENLLFREADIAVRMYRPTQMEIVARKLGEIQLTVCAATTYLNRHGRPNRIEDLAGHDLIGYDQSTLITEGMRAIGIAASRDWFATRCDNQNAYWQLVKAGCGIGFSQRWMVDQTADVEPIEVGVEIPSLPVWLATPEALRRIPRISIVWDHLQTAFEPFVS